MILTDEGIRAALAPELGRIAAVTPLAGSVANQDFALTLADGDRVVLKAGPRSELATEAWTCHRLVDQGVPVPPVRAFDPDGAGLGLPWLILGFVAGEPSEDDEVMAEAGRWIRRVHADELAGWGPLVGTEDPGSPVRGRYDTWDDAVRAELDGVPDLVADGVLDPDLADAARAAITEPFAADPPGVLLHHDLKPAHLFGRDAHLAAIIDWGDAQVGDPLADLARLSMAGPTALAAFLTGYGRELTAADHDLMTRYRIAWNLSSLIYEHRAGGDWFDVYRDRVRADLDRLGR